MSAATCLLSEEHFLCSICFDVVTTPVTIPCDTTSAKIASLKTGELTVNTSAQCAKKHFDQLPELRVNTFVSEMAAQFRQSAVKKASEIALPGEVPCDVCTGIKLKAMKSCLVCLTWYCETQLE